MNTEDIDRILLRNMRHFDGINILPNRQHLLVCNTHPLQ